MRRWSPSRSAGIPAMALAVVASMALVAACTGSADGEATTGDVTDGASGEQTGGSASDADSTSGEGAGEGAGDAGLHRDEAIEAIGEPIELRLPNVPPVVAPDLSTLSATGRDFDGDLTGILGLDVVSASCSEQGGELVYQGSTDASFFDLAADGSGVFRDQSHNNDLTIEIAGDGSGSYRDRGFRMIDVEVGPDGAARYEDLAGSQQHELWSEADGTWTYRRTLANDELTLTVAPDGSGSFGRTGELAEFSIEVDGDGNVAYIDERRDLDLRFTTDGGILDPALVDASPIPEFVVAERFPALDGLAQLQPPCVSILRLDADVLFDFDSAVLQPETERVVERLAQALIGASVGADRTIEIHGHTDAIGDETYNQDLAARRAEAFAAALGTAGVTAELRTVSFGETMPVAPNETADGVDDPAGRQLNRRIEIVIPE